MWRNPYCALFNSNISEFEFEFSIPIFLKLTKFDQTSIYQPSSVFPSLLQTPIFESSPYLNLLYLNDTMSSPNIYLILYLNDTMSSPDIHLILRNHIFPHRWALIIMKDQGYKKSPPIYLLLIFNVPIGSLIKCNQPIFCSSMQSVNTNIYVNTNIFRC